MLPLNGVEDQSKLFEIATSLETNGWVGIELVAIGDELITGSHRYHAARSIGWSDSQIPVIQLEDLAPGLLASHDYPSIGSDDFIYMIESGIKLDVRSKYGIEFG
jgi:hypothetical protein